MTSTRAPIPVPIQVRGPSTDPSLARSGREEVGIREAPDTRYCIRFPMVLKCAEIRRRGALGKSRWDEVQMGGPV